jgi:Fe2+ or Zn2+ uptake regulation protein
MMRHDYNILTEIQAEILGYLENHPDAADTVEGIRQWWLMNRIAEYSHDRVQTALNQLQEARLVESRRLGNERLVFAKTRGDCSVVPGLVDDTN